MVVATLNPLEQECIGLCVAVEAVNDIANHSLLSLVNSSHSLLAAEIHFKTRAHRDLFLIRMQDFANERGDASLFGVPDSCLHFLSRIASSPGFDGDTYALGLAVANMQKWLTDKVKIQLWLSSLDLDARISVPRDLLLRISANQSKHNISRLTRVCTEITKALQAAGYLVDERMIPLALDDLQEHLGENFFLYYATWAAELINEIRWGLQAYLNPEFQRAFHLVPGDPHGKYQYQYPDSVLDEVAKHWYWTLMNHVRSGPHLRRFEASPSFRDRSSLEWSEDEA